MLASRTRYFIPLFAFYEIFQRSMFAGSFFLSAIHRTHNLTMLIKDRMTILGGGIQGVSLALALAHRGHKVTLIESLPILMDSTSTRNEGKIHLGFVYALDPTGATHRNMLESALCFSPLLDKWCGGLVWNEFISDGFYYAIMPDSMIGPERVMQSYERLANLLPEFDEHDLCQPSYFGKPLTWMWRESDPVQSHPFSAKYALQGYIETEERAIDPIILAAKLRRIVKQHPLIYTRCNVRVDRVERDTHGFSLHLDTPTGPEILQSDLVANCTWSGRHQLDRMVGMNQLSNTCYRIKHSIIAKLPKESKSLPPITMVQGPYGDIVPRQNNHVYLSWYPECRTYFGTLPPRDDWDTPEISHEVAQRSLMKLRDLFPDLASSEIVSSMAGVIMAEGSSDIDDPRSTLHYRKDYGVTHHDGWWSIDTGKYTAAPLLAERTAIAISNEAQKHP
jgi:glycine/D-amino acid oxidase-like deaminating enzyme